jgi:carboxypeptidase Taq
MAQVDPTLNDTLSWDGASMAMHESQSRFYENMIGRSPLFWKVHYPKLKETFPEQLRDVPQETFIRYINQSGYSFIRTEADELTYPLHIMLRYEVEKAVVEEGLRAEDIPAFWNERFRDYFGMTLPTDTLGVLQDVHWATGEFGYFPTYALGSAYAAQIYAAMEKDLDVERALASGTTGEINEWLREHIHRYGASRYPKEILKLATGEDFNPNYYVEYLVNKFSSVYDL